MTSTIKLGEWLEEGIITEFDTVYKPKNNKKPYCICCAKLINIGDKVHTQKLRKSKAMYSPRFFIIWQFSHEDCWIKYKKWVSKNK